jgi:hypothetical protein
MTRKRIPDIRQFAIVQHFTARAKMAAKPSNIKYALVCKYKATGMKWEQITDRINAETGSDHFADYYKKLYRRKALN